MKKWLIGVSLVLTTHLFAVTPFSLNGIHSLTVNVINKTDLFDEKIVHDLKMKLAKSMDDLGVKHDKYYKESLILMIKSMEVGNNIVIDLDLIIVGDVTRKEEKDLTFGITYLNSDTIEVENKVEDLYDSVSFLLDEFKEQFKDDNEE